MKRSLTVVALAAMLPMILASRCGGSEPGDSETKSATAEPTETTWPDDTPPSPSDAEALGIDESGAMMMDDEPMPMDAFGDEGEPLADPLPEDEGAAIDTDL